MAVQSLPSIVATMPSELKRKRKYKWLMLCSWQQQTNHFLVPSFSPRCCIERLLKTRDDKLIIWKSVSLKPDFPPSMEALRDLPAKDQEMVNSMKRSYARRVVWKQLAPKEEDEPMGYNDSSEFIIRHTTVWKVKIASERYENQTIKEIEEKLQPERKMLSKTSLRKLNGYVAELINVQMEKEEFLDSEE